MWIIIYFDKMQELRNVAIVQSKNVRNEDWWMKEMSWKGILLSIKFGLNYSCLCNKSTQPNQNGEDEDECLGFFISCKK